MGSHPAGHTLYHRYINRRRAIQREREKTGRGLVFMSIILGKEIFQ
jgi:hypothetical protein